MQSTLQQAFRYALSLTHDRHQAEDLVQEACRRIVERNTKIGKPMLLTTIRNLFIDQYRRMKLVQFEPFDESDHSGELDRTLDALSARMELEPALASLRPEEREALYLNIVEGWTCQEIADFTRRPRGTVLSLIYRAKKTMAKHLQEAGRHQGVAP